MRYVIFAKPSCPFCVKAEEFLTEKKQNFKTVNFQEDQQEILQEIKDAYNWNTVPIVLKVHDTAKIELIGGYTDLVESLKQE